VVNTLPDREADLASGTRGLPQRLSLRTDALLAGAAFVAAAGALSFGPGHLNLVRAVSFALSAAGGLAIAGLSARNGRLAFRLCLLLAALDVALLLLAGR
jgi:hypothetical protein